MRNWLIILITLLCSCYQNTPKTQKTTKAVNYGSFTIDIPVAWIPLQTEYEDSYVGNIKIHDGLFISFDLGMYIYSLDEDSFGDNYEVMDGNIYLVDKKSNINKTYWSKADSIHLEKVRKNKVEWMTIDGRKAKVLIPKKAGDGITGIYIANLYNTSSDNKFKLVMSAPNLTLKLQQEFVTAIKTLKFYNDKGVKLQN